MNIEDKAGMFAETARVLKPGGLFAVYDVMRVGDGALDFPVAWARQSQILFLPTIRDQSETQISP